jgi:Na+-driven multidrug efflux pump
MIMQLVRLWGLRVPLSWFFGFALHMGSRGIWTGMLISNVLAAVLALVFLTTVDWHHKVIEHSPFAAGEVFGGETPDLLPVPAEPQV